MLIAQGFSDLCSQLYKLTPVLDQVVAYPVEFQELWQQGGTSKFFAFTCVSVTLIPQLLERLGAM